MIVGIHLIDGHISLSTYLKSSFQDVHVREQHISIIRQPHLHKYACYLAIWKCVSQNNPEMALRERTKNKKINKREKSMHQRSYD